VTTFARLLARAAGPHNPRLRPLCSLVLLVGTLLSLSLPAPAGAVVSTVEGTSVGLQPRSEALGEGTPQSFANEAGNAVVHSSNDYPIFWDPTDRFHVHHEWETGIETFFHEMGASDGSLGTIWAAAAQYRDRSNLGALPRATFAGPYHDFQAYPAAGCTDPEPLTEGQITCLTDAQLRAQLQSFISSHGLPRGMGTIYYLVTPPGVTVCLDATAGHCSDYSLSAGEESKSERKSTSYKNSFCSYHGDINPDNAAEGDANTVLYAAIPWSAGTVGAGDFSAGAAYENAFDCQDGGWNPEKNKEKIGPKTIQEPNQQGKGEEGDFSAGLVDVIINQIAEEQANVVTDPMLNGWQDAGHHEATDECRNVFADTAGRSVEGSVTALEGTEAGTLSNETVGAGSYFINNIWSFADQHCVGGVGLFPRFVIANPVNTGEPVGFDGMASTVSLLDTDAFGPTGPPTLTYASFTWNFGDGTVVKGFAPGSPVCEAPWLSPCAGSIFHTYAYGGNYEVTLTVTDIAGNVSSTTSELAVAGPPPPTAVAPAASGAATTTGTPAPGAKGGGSLPVKPVVAATIASHSLKTVARSGLVVKYSVNEQVTGHFEVLLSRSLAHKLKISGSAATGLPVGTAPQIVIAKALLVTTKGGRSTFDIKLSKLVAAKLKRAHKAPLMVRLIVRNASSSSPASTTALTSITLIG
jgi:PKD repeat protein